MFRISILLMLYFLNLHGSHDRYAHIEDVKAREIIKSAIENAGGIDTWEGLKGLKYKKDFTLYNSEGGIEKEFKQIHDYNYGTDQIKVISDDGVKKTETLLSKGQYSRNTTETIDDKIVTTKEEDQSKLAKAMNTSLYVVSMPFKLLDPGALITHDGLDTLADGRVLDVLKVVYNAEKHANHSSSEVWKYYFDQEDRKIVRNWIQSYDHLNVVENQTFIREGGILFNGHRKSWRVDADGNRLFLRAEYDYYDYEVIGGKQ